MAGLTRDDIVDHFKAQIEACRNLGSPLTTKVLQIIADHVDTDGRIGLLLENWPGETWTDAVGLRLAAGLHALVLTNADPALAACYPPHSDDTLAANVLRALHDHADFLLDWMKSPPQTNEVRRSAMLAPGFAEIQARTGLPLALLELGASAGLNLNFDRYEIHLGKQNYGKDKSDVVLNPQVEGTLPANHRPPQISTRAGCDARPLDPSNSEARLRLTAYTWPDQADRLQRLNAALNIASDDGLRIAEADAADWLEEHISRRQSGAATVVFHSVFWQYLPPDTKTRIEATLDRAGAEADASAPLAWLSMEGWVPTTYAELRLTTWPGGEMQTLAHCDYHGRWIRWL